MNACVISLAFVNASVKLVTMHHGVLLHQSRSLLHLAVLQNDIETVQVLLEKKADPRAQDPVRCALCRLADNRQHVHLAQPRKQSRHSSL